MTALLQDLAAQPVPQPVNPCPATLYDVLIVGITVIGPVVVAYFAGKERERRTNGSS